MSEDEEHEVAAGHAKALAVSLPVVEDLAASPDAQEQLPRHAPPAQVASWPPPSAPEPVDPSARHRALSAGWIVAPAPPSPPARQPVPADAALRLDALEVAVKDLIDVAGLPVHNGTPGGLWREPTRSAPAWERLTSVGARCAGKAATHEMAWGLTTPQVGNPHDPERYAGGSSGGSAAAVAAGAAHGALGTDTGGSIRVPAALCGVVGLRPTHGSIDTTGITPMAPSQDVVGPLAPNVAGCALLLEELVERPLRSGSDPTSFRVGLLEQPGRMEEQVRASYERVLTHLRDLGVTVVTVPGSPLREAGALSLVTMLAESAALHADAVRRSAEGFGAEFRGITRVGEDLLAERADVTDLLGRARHALRVRAEALFSEHGLDAFLTPTTPCVAPRRDRPTVRLGGREVPVGVALSQYSAWSAATGWPSISVPAPTASLPVGIQLMARPHREDVCLSLGEVVETARGEPIPQK